MSKPISLELSPREITGKEVLKLRKQGIIPGVIYGWQVEPIPVQVEERIFERVYRHAGGSTLLDITLANGTMTAQALIHTVKRDPVTQVLAHFDLLAVNPRAEISTDVPIELVGESPAVHDKEAILNQELNSVHLRGLPKDLPASIEVDISGLTEVDQAIHVRDLPVPAGIHILSDPEQLVVKLARPSVEPVAEEVEAEAEAETAEEAAEE